MDKLVYFTGQLVGLLILLIFSLTIIPLLALVRIVALIYHSCRRPMLKLFGKNK